MNETHGNDSDTPDGQEHLGPSDGETDVATALSEPLVGEGDGDTGLPLETVFDILRNARRQRVLAYLALTDDEVVRIGDLAEHIAAIENDTAVGGLSSQQRKRVYVALYQCHLPKMADADVLEFDKDRGTITTGPNTDQLRPYLDIDDSTDDDTVTTVEKPFAVLSGAAVLAYVLAATGGGIGVAGGGVVLVGGALVALVVAYRRRRTT